MWSVGWLLLLMSTACHSYLLQGGSQAHYLLGLRILNMLVT